VGRERPNSLKKLSWRDGEKRKGPTMFRGVLGGLINRRGKGGEA